MRSVSWVTQLSLCSHRHPREMVDALLGVALGARHASQVSMELAVRHPENALPGRTVSERGRVCLSRHRRFRPKRRTTLPYRRLDHLDQRRSARLVDDRPQRWCHRSSHLSWSGLIRTTSARNERRVRFPNSITCDRRSLHAIGAGRGRAADRRRSAPSVLEVLVAVVGSLRAAVPA